MCSPVLCWESYDKLWCIGVSCVHLCSIGVMWLAVSRMVLFSQLCSIDCHVLCSVVLGVICSAMFFVKLCGQLWFVGESCAHMCSVGVSAHLFSYVAIFSTVFYVLSCVLFMLDLVWSPVLFILSCVQMCFVGCHVLSCVVWTWLGTGVWLGAHGWEGRGNSLYILHNHGIGRINIMLTQVYAILWNLTKKQSIYQIRLAWKSYQQSYSV